MLENSSEASRQLKEFEYQTLDSWSRPRKVIVKLNSFQVEAIHDLLFIC
jgi:hypothetical protein